MAIPNHVVNVTESNLQYIDIVENNPNRKFVIALNMDNINPGAQENKAPQFRVKIGGSLSLRNSTLDFLDFNEPLSPLFATIDGCKVINTTPGVGVINGVTNRVELSTINSIISSTTRDSVDSIKQGAYINNRYYVNGVKVVVA
ncbi:MAG: hypothetical protein ACRCZ2_08660, partial [Fusobacteriaceae bacterium]